MVASQPIEPPSVDLGMLIRRPPHDVFEALADPSITSKFWYTKSSGRMAEGAELTWEWEMYGVARTIRVQKFDTDSKIQFTWDNYNPEEPTTVEFTLIPYENDTTYLHITETGYGGDLQAQVDGVRDSTAGFAYLIAALKAALEHDVTLRLVQDENPPNLQRH
ncbi:MULTISPECIES: SRPBCC family protein [Nocardia]|uniref:Polyketide cyclase n=1 Tax=Nocardia vulneris TaxID=1141657 RepID=A0ABR4ZLG4_9NOCA|nr:MULTISPECIES: SRPBCC family protein [Nocardia]ASF07072.1 polyketide cyclase [Nocardia brasiliensis]KIA66121.1 polyketide cyclase [Nocardia vulneris]MBF6129701.1 SRPBCC family protein [Nocardia brasiliensis]MBF6541411.1 SRPBCC family protein [Nocardia brasiliensis]SUB47669.1 Activator of Hsp90 ATPase homolog 1-like protein [Nocardia brasiliensis]